MSESLRIDKWLWHARFYKTRTLAQAMTKEGRVRLNDSRIGKAHARVKPGDILTFSMGGKVVVVRVLGLGERRGPATEARGLYEIVEGA